MRVGPELVVIHDLADRVSDPASRGAQFREPKVIPLGHLFSEIECVQSAVCSLFERLEHEQQLVRVVSKVIAFRDTAMGVLPDRVSKKNKFDKFRKKRYIEKSPIPGERGKECSVFFTLDQVQRRWGRCRSAQLRCV